MCNSERQAQIELGRLPADHGFVVQFEEGSAADGATNVRGRIEHVISGRNRAFIGWTGDQGLVAALQALLSELA